MTNVSFIAKKTGAFQIAPEGIYTATLADVVDEGVRQNPFKAGQAQHRIKLIWRLLPPDGKTVDQYDWVTLSLHVKSRLLKVVRALTGGNPDTEVDVEALVGLSCQLEIEHHTTRAGENAPA